MQFCWKIVCKSHQVQLIFTIWGSCSNFPMRERENLIKPPNRMFGKPGIELESTESPIRNPYLLRNVNRPCHAVIVPVVVYSIQLKCMACRPCLLAATVEANRMLPILTKHKSISFQPRTTTNSRQIRPNLVNTHQMVAWQQLVDLDWGQPIVANFHQNCLLKHRFDSGLTHSRPINESGLTTISDRGLARYCD